jgi:transcriptional regulator with XRE-family HTH domain
MNQTNTAFAGFKLKGLRTKMQYSLAYTAKELDITTSYLSLIENGKKEPSNKVLTKAAKLFKTPAEAFTESPKLLEDIGKITKNAELSELIQVFEIILRDKS